MAKLIECSNEFGIMTRTIGDREFVYQDIDSTNISWIEFKIDGNRVGFLDSKNQKLLINKLNAAFDAPDTLSPI